MLRFASRVVASVVSSLFLLIAPSLTTTASAAPRPKPVYAQAAPVFSWTGFYVGAHAGWGWAIWGDGITSENGDGVIAGLTLGYNYQFGNYVVGIEGDASFADVKHEETFLAGQGSVKNDYFATITGRLGYAFDRILIYGKGGVAFTRDKWAINDGLGGSASGTFDRTGWTIGFGAEYARWGNISLKAEYNYLHFPEIHEVLTTSGGVAVTPADVQEWTHLFKLGINYRF